MWWRGGRTATLSPGFAWHGVSVPTQYPVRNGRLASCRMAVACANMWQQDRSGVATLSTDHFWHGEVRLSLLRTKTMPIAKLWQSSFRISYIFCSHTAETFCPITWLKWLWPKHPMKRTDQTYTCLCGPIHSLFNVINDSKCYTSQSQNLTGGISRLMIIWLSAVSQGTPPQTHMEEYLCVHCVSLWEGRQPDAYQSHGQPQLAAGGSRVSLRWFEEDWKWKWTTPPIWEVHQQNRPWATVIACRSLFSEVEDTPDFGTGASDSSDTCLMSPMLFCSHSRIAFPSGWSILRDL